MAYDVVNTCIVCGMEFRPYKNFEHQKFCTTRCKNKYWNGKSHHSTKQTVLIVPVELTVEQRQQLEALIESFRAA